MPRIGDLVSSLEIKGKKIEAPDWWATQHKLKKEAKTMEMTRVKLDTQKSYEVNTVSELSAEAYAARMRAELDLPQYNEFAPWSNIHRPSKTIIIARDYKNEAF